MNNQSVSFGKQTGALGGVVSSVGGSLVNVATTVGVGAGIGAGIGKLASLTPYKPTTAALNYQYADMFEKAVNSKEVPAYLQEAGEGFSGLIAKGKRLLKIGNHATNNYANFEVCKQAVTEASEETIKSAEFQKGVKEFIKGKMPEGGFTREHMLERLSLKSQKTTEFLQQNAQKIKNTADEFISTAAENPRTKELAEKGAKHLRNKTIIGTAIALGVVGALVINILKTYGLLKFRMPKKMQEKLEAKAVQQGLIPSAAQTQSPAPAQA